MTAGTRPARRVARAAPLPARSRLPRECDYCGHDSLLSSSSDSDDGLFRLETGRPPGVPNRICLSSRRRESRRPVTGLQSNRLETERSSLTQDRLGHQRRDRQLPDVCDTRTASVASMLIGHAPGIRAARRRRARPRRPTARRASHRRNRRSAPLPSAPRRRCTACRRCRRCRRPGCSAGRRRRR